MSKIPPLLKGDMQEASTSAAKTFSIIRLHSPECSNFPSINNNHVMSPNIERGIFLSLFIHSYVLKAFSTILANTTQFVFRGYIKLQGTGQVFSCMYRTLFAVSLPFRFNSLRSMNDRRVRN